jgi:hypothetical protein
MDYEGCVCVERGTDQCRYSEQVKYYFIVEKYLAYCACVSSDICRNPVVEKYLAYYAHVSSEIYRNPVV